MYIFISPFYRQESECQRQAVTCPRENTAVKSLSRNRLKSLPQRPFLSLKSQFQFFPVLLDSRIIILGIWALRRRYWSIYLNLASLQELIVRSRGSLNRVTQSSTQNNVPLSSRSVCCHSLKNSQTFTPADTRKEGHILWREIAENANWIFYLLPHGYSRIDTSLGIK